MSTKRKGFSYSGSGIDNPYQTNPCKTYDCSKGPPKIYPHEKKKREVIPVYTARERMRRRTNNNVNET
jgi:hypothetical protein